MQTDGVFHVKIGEPTLVRRTLLEASKALLEALHSYERFKTIRIQKIEAVVELRHTMREIVKLIKGLERELPKTNLRASFSKHKYVKNVVRPDKGGDPIVQSQIKKLESELNYIENKLDNLTKP